MNSAFFPLRRKTCASYLEARCPQFWNKIESLSQAAFPSGVRKPEGADRLWRLRVRDYRITCEVDSGMKEITIRYVRHRREAYRQL
jgi:mRNA-degrading endonuclease RelE of RelBE toxin-antitoxin system